MAISIHVPSWGTTPGLCLSHTILKISIHVPSWGTTNLIAIPERFPAFQSTFPRGERLKAQYGVGLSIAYFNPRSLVGNDVTTSTALQITHISIHVPSWGTTQPAGASMYSDMDFNPRSLVGNDCWYAPNWPPMFEFQSTFPRGERRQIFTNILCFFMQ